MQTDKSVLRGAALAYRKKLSADQRRQYSEIVIDTLLAYLTERPNPVRCLLAYRALPSEVNTSTLFHLSDYRIYAPVTHHRQHMEWHLVTPQTVWRKGLFGVLEPTSSVTWPGDQGSVLICPLAAFDRQGNRLGMGLGCFDFWLSRHRNALHRVIGLAFSGQEVARIAAEEHDAPMDAVITEQGVIECQRR
jgi:5-formyltetrahydrofolate cyclo-ligase